MPIELDEMRTFLVVADELHFGRAAARLNVTASPLTRRIQRIEKALGVTLFERSRRGVELTPAGRALREEARFAVQRFDDLPGRLHRVARGDTGGIRLGVIGIGIARPARAIHARLVAESPEVRISWRVASSAELVLGVRQAQLDAAIVHSPVAHAGLAARVVLREPLRVALPVGHRLAARRSIRLRDLQNETFLAAARELSPGDFDRLASACLAEGFSPRIDGQWQSLTSYLGLVAIGAGVALTPASVAARGAEGIVFMPIRGSDPYSELSLLWDPQRTSPVLERILGWFEPDVARNGNERTSRLQWTARDRAG